MATASSVAHPKMADQEATTVVSVEPKLVIVFLCEYTGEERVEGSCSVALK